MTKMPAQEPAAIAGVITAIVNAVQVAAISLPTWAHTGIAVVTILASAITVRQNVTPVSSGDSEV